MDHIHLLLNFSQVFICFVAPPGWGKTRLLLEIFQKRRKRYIYLSPLKALAYEFHQSLLQQKELKERTTLLTSPQEFQDIWKNFLQQPEGILVCTVEGMLPFLSQGMSEGEHFYKKYQTSLIIDEFHLIYKWGETFRPNLWELFLCFCNTSCPILSLTATLNENILNKVKNYSHFHFDHTFVINIGNQKLLNHPTKSLFFHPKLFSSQTMEKHLEYSLINNEDQTFLCFVKTRHQVDILAKKWHQHDKMILTCKGGETAHFYQELQKHPRPHLIITTIALSHGVNLPSISKIFILFFVDDRDMWVQICGRGGRKGEAFSLYTFNSYNPHSRRFYTFINIVKVFFVMLVLKLLHV